MTLKCQFMPSVNVYFLRLLFDRFGLSGIPGRRRAADRPPLEWYRGAPGDRQRVAGGGSTATRKNKKACQQHILC